MTSNERLFLPSQPDAGACGKHVLLDIEAPDRIYTLEKKPSPDNQTSQICMWRDVQRWCPIHRPQSQITLWSNLQRGRVTRPVLVPRHVRWSIQWYVHATTKTKGNHLNAGICGLKCVYAREGDNQGRTRNNMYLKWNECMMWVKQGIRSVLHVVRWQAFPKPQKTKRPSRHETQAYDRERFKRLSRICLVDNNRMSLVV